jgi:hypothetical protein
MPALAAAAATVELEPLELASKPARLPFNVLFTDLDGTCVHYGIPLEEINSDSSGKMLLLPPSTTGPHGVISVRSLQVGGWVLGGCSALVFSWAVAKDASKVCAWHAPAVHPTARHPTGALNLLPAALPSPFPPYSCLPCCVPWE